MENPKYLEEICEKGAKKASLIASKTLNEVYNKIGIIRWIVKKMWKYCDFLAKHFTKYT